MPKLSIIIPCYFNEKNIPVTGVALKEMEGLFPSDVTFEYVFVDDGSGDGTLAELLKLYHARPDCVKVVKLARNFGANNATMAGLKVATGDCNVIIAADLQDPPDLIPKMYEHWRKGFKLVIANRQSREEPLTQTLFSNTYHFLMRRFALPNTPKGGFDLAFFDRQIRDLVNQLEEKNTYLSSLFLWFGFEYVNIPYTRRKREIGKSRWTLAKKIKSFIDSFVGFSYAPIRAILTGGLIIGGLALIYIIRIIIAAVTHRTPVEGWASLMVVLLVVSCIQLLALGVIGEYIWRVLDAARKRPGSVVDRIYSKT